MWSSEPRSRANLVIGWTLAATLILVASAQAAEKKKSGAKAGKAPPVSSQETEKSASLSDEEAIRAAVASYVEAYNRGDAKAVAAHWSESGEWISPTGRRFQGRQAIEKQLAILFAEGKGVRIEVLPPSIRIVSPDVAVEEGTVRVFRPKDLPSEATYLGIHTKKAGQWKLDSVHETLVPDAPSPSAHLQELAWLVGEWVHASSGVSAEIQVAWTKNKNFLSYAFKVSGAGEDDLEGIEVIGWDPAANTLRCWLFDSDGGFGEGVWSKKGKSWVVKFDQVLSDGRKAAATNIYTPVDGNTFTWRSVGRKLEGEFLPNIEDVKIVRKATSSAATPAKAAKTPAHETKN